MYRERIRNSLNEESFKSSSLPLHCSYLMAWCTVKHVLLATTGTRLYVLPLPA